MKISSMSSNIAFLLFLYMIPISHLYKYHQLVGNFSLSNNIFNIIQLITVFVLFLFYILNFIKYFKYTNKVSFAFYIFYIYLFSVSVIHYLNYTIINYEETWKYFRFTYNVLISFITYYLIGYYYNGYNKYYKYLLFLYVLLTINTWWNIDLNTLYISFAGVAKEKAGLYQYLGDTYAIFAILVILLTRNNVVKILLIMSSMIALFILMSRSSLYMFIFVILIYLIVKYRKLSMIYFMVFLIGINMFVLYGGDYYDIIMDSRLMAFTRNGIEKDGSVEERIVLAQVGFQAIKNYWLIGDYGGDVIYFLKQGKYIHNFFSILRQFGIIPFIVYVFFIWKLLFVAYDWIRNNKLYSSDYDYFIIISLFLVFEVFVARAWTHAYIFFPIGILAGLYKYNKWKFSDHDF